jgi:hypothetical protein
VHEYYSVGRFKATYAHALPALEGKQQWDIVDPGFKLCAPILKRAAGRPRKSRIRPRSEGSILGARKRKCTRCGGSGHFTKYCDNAVDPAFRECFDDENEDQQPVDQNEAPSDDYADDQNDQGNFDSRNDQNEAPFEAEQPDVPVVGEQNDAPIDGEQNDAPVEAPNSVVVSSTWYLILYNTIVSFYYFEQINSNPICVFAVQLCGRFKQSGSEL